LLKINRNHPSIYRTRQIYREIGISLTQLASASFWR